jgi:predicted dehydrogenase
MLDGLAATYLIIGFFERDDELAARMERATGLIRFTDPETLINTCDCIDITTGHFDIAVRAVRKSKHVFIEKNVLRSHEEAKKLMRLAAEASVQVQVGYAERFNPAFLSVRPSICRPMLIEVQRLARFTGDEYQPSVVTDLMLHDIDLVLSLVESNVKRVAAHGVSVVNDTPDIVNARVEFNNGCVAVFTASRIAVADQQIMQLFQRDASLKIDLLEKESEVMAQKTLVLPSGMVAADSGASAQLESFSAEKQSAPKNNPLEQQFRSFAHAIRTGCAAAVSIEDAHRTMELAAQISDRLRTIRR